MVEPGMMRLIDGRQVSEGKIVARCHVLTHPGHLTKGLVEEHDCITKKCTFLEKTNTAYWQALESAARHKRYERALRKREQRAKTDRDSFIRMTLEANGHIHVTSVCETAKRLLAVSYIYDKRIDLSPEIRLLCRKYGKTLKLQARFGSTAAIEALIREPRQQTVDAICARLH